MHFKFCLEIFKLTPSFVSKHTTLPLLCYILCVITLLWSFTAITGLLVNENVWLFLDAVTYICLALYCKKKKDSLLLDISGRLCWGLFKTHNSLHFLVHQTRRYFFISREGGRALFCRNLLPVVPLSQKKNPCSSHPCSSFCWKDVTLSHACLGENHSYMCGLVRRLVTRGGSRPLQAFTTSYLTNAACSGGGEEHRGTDIPKNTQVGTFHIHYS